MYIVNIFEILECLFNLPSLSQICFTCKKLCEKKRILRDIIFFLCVDRPGVIPFHCFHFFIFYFSSFIFSTSTCQGFSQTTIPDRLRNVLCLIWKQETYRNVILKEYVWSKVFTESIDTLQQFDSYSEWFYRNLIKIYCQIYCHW